MEFTACPVADMKGNYYQDVFFRVMKFNATGGVVDARYFDTYAFRTTGSESSTVSHLRIPLPCLYYCSAVLTA